jgi:hypothetical protein
VERDDFMGECYLRRRFLAIAEKNWYADERGCTRIRNGIYFLSAPIRSIRVICVPFLVLIDFDSDPGIYSETIKSKNSFIYQGEYG